MAKKWQLRRGTTSQNNSFTGAEGEVTVDTTTHELRVHDGSTQGGHIVGKYNVTSKTAAGLCPQLPNETTTTKYLRQDGTWNTTPYPSATSKTAAGLCPQLPNETTTTKYLRQDGTWNVPDYPTDYIPKTGGTITAYISDTLATAQVRNISIGSSVPSSGKEGDIHFVV